MRVVLLGGAGFFCRSIIAEYSVRLPADYEFVIADYDYRTARKMAKKLGDRFSARMVDVADSSAFGKVMEEAHLAVSFIGPWYRFGESVVENALRSEKPLVAANTGTVTVPEAQRERLAHSRVCCVTGISLYPGALALLAGKVSNRFPGTGNISFTLKIDTVRFGGLAFIREYFHHLSRESDIAVFGDIGERGRITLNPSGLFQRLAAGGRGGMRTEMLSAFQEMARIRPVPGNFTGVTLTASLAGEKETGALIIPGEKLLMLLSGMLAGASAVALESGSGGLVTIDELANNPAFMKHVENDLQETIETG